MLESCLALGTRNKQSIKKCFLFYFKIVLARQGLALRSHDDLSSNFHQLLLLRSEDNPELTDWILKKKCKHSHEIQNECLQIMAMHIVRRLSQAIRTAAYFAVMADECTEFSNKEQFTICIRWVGDDLVDHEDNIGLYQVDSINSEFLLMQSWTHCCE